MKKRKILALVLACATLLSLVGCGNTASTEDTSKDTTNDTETTVETESEKEPEIDQNAWESLTVTIDDVNITMGDTLSTPWLIPNGFAMFAEAIHTFNGDGPESGPSIHGVTDTNITLQKRNGDKLAETPYKTKEHNISVYYPTHETEAKDTIMYRYTLAFDYLTISKANKGETEIPEIILPNGLKIGQYLQGGCPEIIEVYGEPDEEKPSKTVNGAYEYIYHNADKTKTFIIYTEGSYIVGFRMWISPQSLAEWNPDLYY